MRKLELGISAAEVFELFSHSFDATVYACVFPCVYAQKGCAQGYIHTHICSGVIRSRLSFLHEKYVFVA
jgi:hypothetical protein